LDLMVSPVFGAFEWNNSHRRKKGREAALQRGLRSPRKMGFGCAYLILAKIFLIVMLYSRQGLK